MIRNKVNNTKKIVISFFYFLFIMERQLRSKPIFSFLRFHIA